MIEAGRAALAVQLGQAPACLAVTPFQSGIGQGRGHQKYLPIPDLVRTERRVRHLSTLEQEKWLIPAAGALPRWGTLPLERCTEVKTAKQSMAGQIAALESYADSSPMSDLAGLAGRKAAKAQARDQQLTDLRHCSLAARLMEVCVPA